MSDLLIRKLSDETKKLLRVRAAENGHSLAEEARLALDRSVRPSNRIFNPRPGKTWYDEFREQMDAIGRACFDVPEYEEPYQPFTFEDDQHKS
jgi:plasmid stability protein